MQDVEFTVERDHLYMLQTRSAKRTGVAALKEAHRIFTERGYRSRVLSAAFRNHMQWSELQGGDLVVSPPFDWQKRINENGIAPENRIDVPVDPEVLRTLRERSGRLPAGPRTRRRERYELDTLPGSNPGRPRERGCDRDAHHSPGSRSGRDGGSTRASFR